MSYQETIIDSLENDTIKEIAMKRKKDEIDLELEMCEWINTFPEKWRKEKRIEYFQGIVDRENKYLIKCRQKYLRLKNYWKKYPDWWKENIWKYLWQTPEHQKKLDKAQKSIYFTKNADKIKRSITPEMIVRATEFPIDKLVEVNSAKFAHCISRKHRDLHPSMYCRKNFAWCFSCGYNANVIKLYQDLYGVGFVDAVKKLNGV